MLKSARKQILTFAPFLRSLCQLKCAVFCQWLQWLHLQMENQIHKDQRSSKTLPQREGHVSVKEPRLEETSSFDTQKTMAHGQPGIHIRQGRVFLGYTHPE